MGTSSRTTTIQITLLNDAATPPLRGRIRLAGGATLPFVGARELVTHLQALLQTQTHLPPQSAQADATDASGAPQSRHPEAGQE